MPHHGPSQPRESGIRFSIPETTTIDGFLVRPGAVIQPAAGDRPITLSSASVEISYERTKGRKVVLRAPVDPDAPSIHPDAHLLQYDAVFAIDTNTRPIADSRVSVSALSQCHFNHTGRTLDAQMAVPEAAEFHGIKGDPEREGWRHFCEAIQDLPDYSPQLKIGIVVDSSLDALADVNNRIAPLIDDWYLPVGMMLIFASDVSADTVANQMIRFCDHVANEILALVASGSVLQPLGTASEGAPYSHFRWWSRSTEQ